MKKIKISIILLIIISLLSACGKTPEPSAETNSNTIDEPMYSLRDQGPAGGWVFYDKGNSDGGWRYLEAAPSDQTASLWGSIFITVSGLRQDIGTGKQNTINILADDNHANKAAEKCDGLNIDGKNDWFLPSYYELKKMYENLKLHNTGNLSDSKYWSSSQSTSLAQTKSYYYKMSDGDSGWEEKNTINSVRCIRSFNE